MIQLDMRSRIRTTKIRLRLRPETSGSLRHRLRNAVSHLRASMSQESGQIVWLTLA